MAPRVAGSGMTPCCPAKIGPRRGWSWGHCWEDAIALVGSKEAVQNYIVGQVDEDQHEPTNDGSKGLSGNPLPVKSKRRKLFWIE